MEILVLRRGPPNEENKGEITLFEKREKKENEERESRG